MKSRWLGVLPACGVWLLVLAGCNKAGYPAGVKYSFAPYPELVGEEKKLFTLSAAVKELFEEQLRDYFGTPREPIVAGIDESLRDDPEMRLDDESLQKGSLLYRRLCLYCHGINGDASGPTGYFLQPKPRDFRRGFFKFKSTAKLAPSRDDLKKTLLSGIPGASMPAFNLLSEDDLDNLVSYVIHLGLRGQVERRVAGQMEQEQPYDIEAEVRSAATDWLEGAKSTYKPSLPGGGWQKVHEAGLADRFQRGAAIYKGDGACVQCHGSDGRASTQENSINLTRKNDWGDLNPPRDSTIAVYRGGSRPLDLFYRLKLGIKGSGMPEAATKLSDEDLWHLVDYVMSLPQRR